MLIVMFHVDVQLNHFSSERNNVDCSDQSTTVPQTAVNAFVLRFLFIFPRAVYKLIYIYADIR